jgi:TRAP transporter TAXI family solute receptor
MNSMKKGIWIICWVAGLLASAGPAHLRAQEVFITIGSGDVSGVYYPTGLAIAQLINAERDVYGIRAAVEATNGATFNLNGIMAGYLEFGLAQSDTIYQAINGLAAWEDKGPQEDLRAVFSLHQEAVTLVAAVDAGITTLADLKGKRVSLGNPGISRHRTVMNVLQAVGLDPKRDMTQFDVMASDAPALLQDNRIDAYFFIVGHPSETVKKGLSGERQTRIIPIAGPAIDQLVAEKSYYSHGTIPVRRLYPGVGDQPDVPTMGVVAVLCTSSRVPEDVVYAVTRVVFANFETFRFQHPAFHDLTKEGMLKALGAPLHPGAQRYYREAGLLP